MILLVDMNLSPRWVHFLEASGLKALHWSTIGAVDASDRVITEYANANSMVVLTNDLDFSAILAATKGEKPSVVQIRSVDLNPEAIGQTVVLAIKQVQLELGRGALLSVDPVRYRLRLLPLI
jgi:predicted nuclease of predicted toxin-antitoxin system